MNDHPEPINSELEGRDVAHSEVSLSQVIMPAQAGPGGLFAHGGEIIKLMDTAAGLTALRHSHCQVVTLRIEGINFLHPVRVGNLITVKSKMTFAGKSVMEIQVRVIAEYVLKERVWEALTSYFIFVAVDEFGKHKEVPPLIVSSEEERKLFEAGRERYTTCRLDDHYKILCAID
jgi:acyl-CoA hydrolase